MYNLCEEKKETKNELTFPTKLEIFSVSFGQMIDLPKTMLVDTMHGHEICKTNLCMLVFIMGLVAGVLGCLVGNMAKKYKEALV